jgi:hypothetical protein
MMDKRTSDALELSIKHWKANVAAETPEAAQAIGDFCALCDLFAHRDNSDDECYGCPVADRSGARFCNLTPWKHAFISLREWKKMPGSESRKMKWRAAAQAEVDFLVSLREPLEATS